MKIVLFNFSNGVYFYASGDCAAVGGAERQQWLLARALVSAGWTVTVGLQGVRGVENGVTVEGVRFVSLREYRTYLAPYQRQVSLYRFLQRELPDWWYWRCASYVWGPAVAIAKFLGVRTIFAAGFDTDVDPRRALVERPGLWPLYAWGLFHTDKIFVQHRDQLSDLPGSLRDRAAVVPSMITRSSKPKPHYERQKYVAWVGMLRQPKRPDLLLEIAQKAPELRFIVCGGPSSHRSPEGYGARIVASLEALPNVDYRGQVAPEKAHEIIANASILLRTSEGEGFPNIFLEAWANGTPVVSMKIDPDGAINRLRLGTVAKNVDQIIIDLTALLNSPGRREEISLRASSYLAENHSEKVVARAFHRALNVDAGLLLTEQLSTKQQNECARSSF